MVDWNVIRYITDKIGQGENPEAIKKQLVESGYDQKIINESFTQAIPWLKPEEQKKIQAMQQELAAKPTVSSAPSASASSQTMPSAPSIAAPVQQQSSQSNAQQAVEQLQPSPAQNQKPTETPATKPTETSAAKPAEQSASATASTTTSASTPTNQETKKDGMSRKWLYLSTVGALILIIVLYFLLR